MTKHNQHRSVMMGKVYAMTLAYSDTISHLSWPEEWAALVGDDSIAITGLWRNGHVFENSSFNFRRRNARIAGRPLIRTAGGDSRWLWHQAWYEQVRAALPQFKHKAYPAMIWNKLNESLFSNEYLLIQVNEAIDGVDLEQSLILDREGLWMSRLRRIVFKEAATGRVPVFRDKRLSPEITFVSEEFKNLLERLYPRRLIDNVAFVDVLDSHQLEQHQM